MTRPHIAFAMCGRGFFFFWGGGKEKKETRRRIL